MCILNVTTGKEYYVDINTEASNFPIEWDTLEPLPVKYPIKNPTKILLKKFDKKCSICYTLDI